MKKTTLFIIAFLPLVFLVFQNCKNNTLSPDEVLSAAKEKLKNGQSIHYDFKLHVDDRANKTNMTQSAELVFSKLDSSRHDYGLYAKNEEFEFIFDGYNLYDIMHDKKSIIRYAPEEIDRFVESSVFVPFGPLKILEVEKFDQVFDTLKEGKKYFVFQQRKEGASVYDKKSIEINIKQYYIDPISKNIHQLQIIGIDDNDTSRVNNIYFTNYQFENTPFDFSKIDPRNLNDIDQPSYAKYQEMSWDDYRNRRKLKQVQEETQLTKKTYQNINGQDVALYGNIQKKTLVMISFVGCVGCEYAMKEMRQKKYLFKDEIDFYYSSPIDVDERLKKYLVKKEFPHGAFSKESQMKEAIPVVSYPTFVLVDAKGKVEKVISSYTEEVEEIIFGDGAD